MHRGLTAMIVAIAAMACLAGVACAADKPAPIRVLMITGDDVMPAHNWPDVSAVTREGSSTTSETEKRGLSSRILWMAGVVERQSWLFAPLRIRARSSAGSAAGAAPITAKTKTSVSSTSDPNL